MHYNDNHQYYVIFIENNIFAQGITRMERWERAQKFGLNPPETIKDLISQHLNNETYTEW